MNGYGDRALLVIAIIATILLLQWGAPFFIPFFMAMMIAYALAPLVDVLTKFVRYRVLSATLVVTAAIALLGVAAWSLTDDARRLWEQMPVAAKTIAASVKKAARTPASPMLEVKKAAAEIEAATQTGKPPSAAAAAAPAPATPFWTMVWRGGQGVATAAAQVMVVVFLVFFMLASGDLFKRKLVRIIGTTLAEKKITIEMIDEIDLQIRRYLFVLLVSNVLVGIGTWGVFHMMGVNYPELWGMTAAVVHTAPYFGPALIAIGSLVAGFLQFGNWSDAFLVSGASILVATLVGSVFATWLASRQSQMNPTATFIGLLFFGWIWGFWGILLGIPLLAIVKTVCDHNDQWEPVAELLSR